MKPGYKVELFSSVGFLLGRTLFSEEGNTLENAEATAFDLIARCTRSNSYARVTCPEGPQTSFRGTPDNRTVAGPIYLLVLYDLNGREILSSTEHPDEESMNKHIPELFETYPEGYMVQCEGMGKIPEKAQHFEVYLHDDKGNELEHDTTRDHDTIQDDYYQEALHLAKGLLNHECRHHGKVMASDCAICHTISDQRVSILGSQGKFQTFRLREGCFLSRTSGEDLKDLGEQAFINLYNKNYFLRSHNVKHYRKELARAEPGYHAKPIQRGSYGRVSKIIEEAEELKDAAEQGVKLMVHQELADLYGAIEGYLESEYPEITMQDLKEMSDVTKRAFATGERTTKR